MAFVDVRYRALALAVARNHACLISRAGEVFCWGDGTHGQLGLPPDALEDCDASLVSAGRST